MPGNDGGLYVPRMKQTQKAPTSDPLEREADAAAAATVRQGGLLVEDDELEVADGQMRKGPFMDLLRELVRTTAEEEVSKAGRSSRDCPYIERMLDQYDRRPVKALEKAIRRWAPEARFAARAVDYLAPVGARLRRGIGEWAQTGRMPADAPDELSGGGVSPFMQVALSIGRAFSGLFTKSNGGSATVDAPRAELGSGRALDSGPRARMEQALGHSFGDVRVHDDAAARSAAGGLRAQAFTIGTHVAFGAGKYKPGTPAGDALLAHELAHVVQQRGGDDRPQASAEGALESDADQTAAGAVTSLWSDGAVETAPRPKLSTAPRLQRCSEAPKEVKQQAAPPTAAKPPEAAKDQAKAPDAPAAEPAAPAPERKVDWMTALPEAALADEKKRGKRKEGVWTAQGQLTDFVWDQKTDKQGIPVFSYRKDVGAFANEPKEPEAGASKEEKAAWEDRVLAAKQVEEARKRISPRTFSRINDKDPMSPKAGFERSNVQMAPFVRKGKRIEAIDKEVAALEKKKGSDTKAADKLTKLNEEREKLAKELEPMKAELAADADYAKFLTQAKQAATASGIGKMEGDPSSFQGWDRANLTWGPGLAASGGEFQKELKAVMDASKSPEANRAFMEAGIATVDRTEVGRGAVAVVVVDTEKKWKLVGADAELYLRARPDLMALFVNVAQGYVDGIDKPPVKSVRERVLAVQTAQVTARTGGGPPPGVTFPDPQAQDLAAHAVFSGWFTWAQLSGKDADGIAAFMFANRRRRSISEINHIIPATLARLRQSDPTSSPPSSPPAPQKKAIRGDEERLAPPGDPAVLAGRLGGGLPLDPPTRAHMERSFQHLFNDVRIHADSTAASLARGLGARAFTVGPHIAFGAGEYRPGAAGWHTLLAHELAHVVQQRRAPAGPVSDAPEREADRAADLAADGRAVGPLGPAPASVARQAADPAHDDDRAAPLDVDQVADALSYYQLFSTTDQSKKYTNDIVSQIQEALGLEQTGKADEPLVQAVARKQRQINRERTPMPPLAVDGKAGPRVLPILFPVGLAKETSIEAYAGDARKAKSALVAATGNEAKAAIVLRMVNARLSAEGIPAIKEVTVEADLADRFLQGGWSDGSHPWSLNLRPDTLADVDQAVVTGYHEARHAEQAFRVARMLARKGRDAERVAAAAGVPADIARAALAAEAAKPMSAMESLEAEGWHEGEIGKPSVPQAQDRNAAAATQLFESIAAFHEDGTPVRRARMEAAFRVYQQTATALRDQPSEHDAYLQGDRVRDKLGVAREKMPTLDELLADKRFKKPAR
jgi:hypothetical protein